MPVMAPDLKASFKPAFRPDLAASVVRTFACTDTFMPMKPAAPDKAAPMMKPSGTCQFRNRMTNSTTTTTPTMPMVRYWRPR